MQVYRIAEMDIAVSPRYAYTKEYLKDYAVDADTYDFSVEISDEDLKKEKSLAIEPLREELYEVTAILRVICDEILLRGGFFLHCSCLEFEGKALIFTAPSGTGKSTHARLWRERYPEKVKMINDDKPLIRKKDDGFYIYGTPWNGKHRLSNNISAPISAVFFLEQAEKNYTEPVLAVEALTLLLKQTVFPRKKSEMSALIDMLSKLIETVPMVRLYCDISYDAVEAAYKALKLENEKE